VNSAPAREAPRAPKISPELAVVVLSFRAPDSCVEAVRSLLDQDASMEIVVVNSGGGHAAAKLAAHGIQVRVIEREDRLTPGAARNLGIMATRAEHIAFLASDCRAGPGWAERRLAKHREGALAVGSALLPLPVDSAIAWASHLSLFVRRLPSNSRLTALPYGSSFRRSLFEDYGPFSEELRIGEDTEFSSRLPPNARPVWAPEIVAFHDTPTRLKHMLLDQFRRGRLASAYARESRSERAGGLVRHLWRRIADPIRLSRRIGISDQGVVRKAWFLIPLCAAAYCSGLAIAAPPHGNAHG
jgi:GT2 family glycosyltransferase